MYFSGSLGDPKNNSVCLFVCFQRIILFMLSVVIYFQSATLEHSWVSKLCAEKCGL